VRSRLKTKRSLPYLANVIAVTIENQRLAEERREQAEEAWRLISARLAHKIGNQNFAAKGLLDGLLECSLPDDAKELVAHIRQCATAIDQVVTEAKRFSGPLTLNRTLTPLAEFVEATVGKHKIANWNVECTFSHDDHDLTIDLDTNEIRHVLMELLENSQGFRPNDAHIIIDTACAGPQELEKADLHGEYAVIDYRDDGPGVKRSDKEGIFEPFVSYRQGSGLGLSIVRQIIEAHGGKAIECGMEHEGARFLIFLPLQPGG
jgi:signal transduction histidine kinase